MSMHRGMAFLSALACSLAATPAYAFSGESTLSIVSDYRWRGLSYSDEDPSLQVEATGWFESGAWLWGGLNTVSDDLGGAEIGLGAGYDASFATLDWSFGVIGYTYPDADDYDYFEMDISAAKGFGPFSFSAGVEYAPAQDNYDRANTYTWIGFDLQLARWNVHAHAGNDDDLIEPGGHTTDYSIGVGRAFAHFAADLSFVEAESDDSTWVLRLSHTFP